MMLTQQVIDLEIQFLKKNKRLADILEGIASLNFGHFEDNKIDLFGDAYENLVSNYASNAGKSSGEFFTPQNVSKLLDKIVMLGRSESNKINKIDDIITLKLIQISRLEIACY